MKIIRGLHNFHSQQGCVATIGNFDGVHLGHQQILKSLVSHAKKLNLPSVLISFSPTPQAFFGKPQATLSSFKEKHKLLEALGLEQHLIINFNANFARLSADEFIRKILLDKLQVRFCLIGDDFRFGAGRKGDFALLQSFDFQVQKAKSLLHQQARISSSGIRKLLKTGDFELAKKMLGRDFSITGKIIRGRQLGATIGFPTINIPIKRSISPLEGVFAVKIKLKNNTFKGVCNLGKRPTVGGETVILEVFIFDFSQDIYGEIAEVIFKLKIRDEQKFESFEALKMQIKLDAKIAKEYFD
ncbi:MAG: bifunctional riboflavin kinase/FAD synthetase [Candidatus Thioglobus sp.]|nr:bifunctional riboflavin kinase/FAD synthetase [Candidatus Thioglobus sp.]